MTATTTDFEVSMIAASVRELETRVASIDERPERIAELLEQQNDLVVELLDDE